jgi:hypothetical protein
MAISTGRKRSRALSCLATVAVAAALVGTTAATASAAPAKPAPAPEFELDAVDSSGNHHSYFLNGAREMHLNSTLGKWKYTATANVNPWTDTEFPMYRGSYAWFPSGFVAYHSTPEGARKADEGWNAYDYDRILAPGSLSGDEMYDVIARDKSGVLWLHEARPDGTLKPRTRIGGGWGIYTDIAGKGDLTGDGKADIVAKDKNGILWLYQGTGDAKAPFAKRTRVGGGWNQFNYLVSGGDVNLDGRVDLLARDTKGAMWLYKGTGDAKAPFAKRVRLDDRDWSSYTYMG